MQSIVTRLQSALVVLIGGILLCQTPAQASTGTPFATLPPEAQQTLRLIKSGGPFPYDRDGVVFGNFEKRLPVAQKGYYHEYTVKTPGEKSRGARRIVAGGTPPVVFYYTDDHYKTFRTVQE